MDRAYTRIESSSASLFISYEKTGCLFSYFFVSALLQSQLAQAWKTLGLSQHIMCFRAGGSHFWYKPNRDTGGTEQFQDRVHPNGLKVLISGQRSKGNASCFV